NGYLTRAEIFLSGEFLTIYTLIGGIFALYQGINEIGGKIEDHTIINYLSKKISRSSFFLWQSITNFYYLISSNALVWIGIYLSFVTFTTQENLPFGYFFWGFISTSILFSTICSLAQLLSISFNRNIAIFSGIATLVFSWFLNSLSNLSSYTAWLKPLSIYYYLNIDKLQSDFGLDLFRLIVLILLASAGYWVGERKLLQKNIY
ncbi:MAG: hypothetical protein AAGF07_05340, partial [Patescibacteria group bacterium]